MPYLPPERVATHADNELDAITGVPEHLPEAPTRRSVMRPSLVCVSGPDLGKSFPVGNLGAVIGRGRVDVVLSQTDVSRRHARVGFAGYGWELEDLHSANGTLVNGVRVTSPMPLHPGDRIQLGRTVLVFAQHDELEQRVERMQRLEALATLAGGIAHDFNNALAVILCNLEVVASSLAPGAVDGQQAVTEMETAATAAAALAKRLLRLGRAEPMPFAHVALEPIANQAAAMTRHRAGDNVSITVDVPRDLAALGSADELQQALLNLCINACDAMPGGGRLAITGRLVKLGPEAALANQLPQAGEYVELAVSDTGCGMDEATLARAFEPFFTTKPRDHGTGLGLAMIHTSVRRHGGAIDVESTPGRGTTFRLRLPRG
jgi:signal transduction histidine kinase